MSGHGKTQGEKAWEKCEASRGGEEGFTERVTSEDESK